MYRPTREGDFLQDLLKDFHGVLVSDFYAAYDSIECLQQKCLIHLMRDMNQELLSNPYDEELRSITRPFGTLLRAIVETVDNHGLKRRALQKHQARTWTASSRGWQRTRITSEAAETLRGRMLKIPGQAVHVHRSRRRALEQQQRRERHQDGSPTIERVTTGMLRESGLSDYLVLLSIFQTCRYKGVSFLKFLVSGLRDIDIIL